MIEDILGKGDIMIDLKSRPFNLTDEQVKFVNDTLNSLSEDEKIGQIFCPIGMNPDEEFLKNFVEEYKPGGILYRPMPSAQIRQVHELMQGFSKVPMLLAANLENGGNGIAADGTYFSRPMGVGATDDLKQAYRLGSIAGKEAAAVGCNWAFAPICDLDMNFKNPITNVRTFGNNKERNIKFVKEQMRGFKEFGVATAVKHFPGDGVDERDQHLLASVNSLSVEEYDKTYGAIWQEIIDAGTLSIMVGHILQPAYTKAFNHQIRDEDILPATLCPEILQGLLRGKMGFNGLIVTDATPMMGFNTYLPRKEALPQAINAGCDMLLFNKDIREDYAFVHEAVAKGVISKERLEEAVTRVLAMKAAMGLFEKKEAGSLVPSEVGLDVISCDEHKMWTKECANKAVTLVKDTQNLLPISPERFKRVRLYLLTDRDQGGFKDGDSALDIVKPMLEKEGFEVSLFNYEQPDFHEMFEGGVDDVKNKFDLAIYIACVDTASNQSVRRIDWMHLMAADAPWFVADIPTIFISLANPYHLFDVPMIKTFINAYTPNKETIEAVVDKIMGRSEFTGKSPVDPFCGVWGAEF